MKCTKSNLAVCLAAAGTIAIAVAFILLGAEAFGFLLCLALIVRLIFAIFMTLEEDDWQGVVLIFCIIFTLPAAFLGSLGLADFGPITIGGLGLLLVVLSVVVQVLHCSEESD